MTNTFQQRITKRMRRISPRQVFARGVVRKRREEFQEMWRQYEAFRELYAKIKELIAEVDGQWDLSDVDAVGIAALRGKKQGLLDVLNYIESNVSEAFQDQVVPRVVVADTADTRPETDTAESAPESPRDTTAEVH